MVEAPPSATLVVPEADLLLELLIVALNAPAQLGEVDQAAEGGVLWQGREPVFGRRVFALGPFDQQPFLRLVFGLPMTMPDPNTHACKARGQPTGRTLPPLDRAPSFLRQSKRKLLGRDQPGLVAAPLLGCGSAPALGFDTGRPHESVRLNAGHIDQAQ